MNKVILMGRLTREPDVRYSQGADGSMAVARYTLAVDIRALEVPELNMKDMQDIGKAFVLSGQKKATLQEMINNETKLMENIVLASIKEGH